jgi:MFS family permease
VSAIGPDPSSRTGTGAVTLGLRANWRQFALLVLINGFVGGMVGIERTVVPLTGSEEFHIASTTLVVTFIVSFGVIKAFANLFSGHLADVWGRKRVVIAGWLFGVPRHSSPATSLRCIDHNCWALGRHWACGLAGSRFDRWFGNAACAATLGEIGSSAVAGH